MTDEQSWLPLADNIIRRFEGCVLRAYPDPGTNADPWTIGWGSTGPDIRKGVTWTQSQADARLLADLTERYGPAVDELTKGHATGPQQKAALVSFAYNLGTHNLKQSTLLAMHNAGRFDAAALQFGRWDKAAGRVLPGLVKRRAAEAELYRSGP